MNRWFLAASLALYVAGLLLPADIGEVWGPGACWFLMGGYFLAGIFMVPANLIFVFGWVALLRRRRKAAMVLGACALFVGIVGALLVFEMLLHSPAYYAWLASFAVLIAGGYYLPRSEPSRPAPSYQEEGVTRT
jgi:hypothetical protein